VNYVTCHDGFTLADLVSYNGKHNEANGEDNQDGTDDNRSWNCGAEGPSDDPAVRELRARQVRNFLVTLFCSQGVPMLLAGDELGRTQQGSNNAYCQDSPVSWVDWENAAKYADLADFTAALSALRRAHPVFRRRRFFSGHPAPGGLRDIIWLNPSGREMTDADWRTAHARSLAVFLNGDAITEPGNRGEPVRDKHFLLLFNAHSDAVRFALPGADHADGWHVVVDTAAPSRPGTGAGGWPAVLPSGTAVDVTGRSVMVLRAADAPADGASPASPARTVGPLPRCPCVIITQHQDLDTDVGAMRRQLAS
jgi:glycogen operon protein